MVYVLATADACSDYALANILSLTQTAFQIICIAVPIILIISIILTIISIITTPDQKGIIKKEKLDYSRSCYCSMYRNWNCDSYTRNI